MNLSTKSRLIALTGLLLLTTHVAVIADDLDDGIAIDTPLNDDLNPDLNIQFITAMARSKAKSGSQRVITNDDQNNGLGNINIGANANLRGAIIVNLSENKNTAVLSR